MQVVFVGRPKYPDFACISLNPLQSSSSRSEAGFSRTGESFGHAVPCCLTGGSIKVKYLWIKI